MTLILVQRPGFPAQSKSTPMHINMHRGINTLKYMAMHRGINTLKRMAMHRGINTLMGVSVSE